MAGQQQDPRVRLTYEGVPLNARMCGALLDPEEPLDPVLRAAAAKQSVTPTAGGYAIERFTLPTDIVIPPESMTLDEDVFPMTLEEVPPYKNSYEELLKSIPKELLLSEGGRPYVYSPMKEFFEPKAMKDDEDEETPNKDPNVNDLTEKLRKTMLMSGPVADVKRLEKAQALIAAEAKKNKAPKTPTSPTGTATTTTTTPKSKSKSKSKGSKSMGNVGSSSSSPSGSPRAHKPAGVTHANSPSPKGK